MDVIYAEKLNEVAGSPTIAGVSLEVTPEQSVELQHAIEFGSVRLGIVKGGYYVEQEIPPFRMYDVSDDVAEISEDAEN